MNEFNNYEYVVDQKLKGAKILRKVGLIFGYFIFVIAWLVFGFVSKLFPLLALCPVTLWMAVFFTWRYVQLSYAYSAVSGDVTFSVIYGGRSKKKLCEVRIKDCTAIAPLDDEHAELVANFAPERIIDCRSYEGAADSYFLLVELDGEKTVVYFQATEKFLKVCRFYNSAATIETKVRF